MDYNKDKVDDMTLALLYLVMSRTPQGARAWKGFDASTLARLHQKGWIAEPKIKEMTLRITDEGIKRAEELFQQHFQ